MSQDLETILRRLAELMPTAQQRYEAKRREQDETGTAEQLWLELQYDDRYGKKAAWECAYVYLQDEAVAIAFRATGRTPTEAAMGLLREMEASK